VIRTKVLGRYGLKKPDLVRFSSLGLVHFDARGYVEKEYEADLAFLASLTRLAGQRRAVKLALGLRDTGTTAFAVEEILSLVRRVEEDCLTVMRGAAYAKAAVLPLDPDVYRITLPETAGEDPDTYAEAMSAIWRGEVCDEEGGKGTG
jgi:hypothetical protein